MSSIMEYIEDSFNSVVALKIYNKINNHIDSLAFFPRIGTRDDSLSTARIEIRYIINTPNIIHYGIIENTIVIISVFDTRRSQDTITKIVREFIERYK